MLHFFSGNYAEGLARQEELLSAGVTGLQALALDHPPTFTFGRHARAAHLLVSPAELVARGVAVCQTDRGGEVTYHGPGQLVFYPLFDIRALGLKRWVWLLEEAMLAVLSSYDVGARRREGVPGVFVGEDKIGFIGLRIRAGISTHGLSLNLGGNLAPFGWMNPCGHQALKVTSILQERGVEPAFEQAARRLMDSLSRLLVTRDPTIERKREANEDSRVSSQGTVP